ncbi:hypothetical protein RND81_05G179700 [Saponaria officinalis]|uniref:Endonuclease/exonuclease/phosphatase domain-containing protein n=1 Tax=Saponaria officinalis TaxID=3572 RepID=A0AAW1KYY8_SAPOF
MKICSWNVRGCNNPLKFKEVIDFFKVNKVDVMGILETKIREHKAARVINRYVCGLKVVCNYNVLGNGRIWLVWNPRTVTVLPITSYPQFVHCVITHHGSNSTCFGSFVYASNDPTIRIGLWDSLRSLNVTQEWLVLGDFNVVRDASERISISLPNLADILDFNSCLLSCGLVDLQSTRVWSKLDRALVNGAWFSNFGSPVVAFLPSGMSDHSSVLVSVLPAHYRPLRFSFLNYWSSFPGFQSLIHET